MSLVACPTNSKLLAIVGRSEVAVIVLPRKEWSALISGKIECRTASVGPYYHGPRSSTIASIKWHPLGNSGAALCILTEDAVLREYNINGDASEPVNTLDFTQSTLARPSHARPSRSSFASHSKNTSVSRYSESAEDCEAVALGFGSGVGDWGLLTGYCLMRDGALYAVCPYLPQDA